MDPDISILYQNIVRRNEQLVLRSVWEFLVSNHENYLKSKSEDIGPELPIKALYKLSSDLNEIIAFDLDNLSRDPHALF